MGVLEQRKHPRLKDYAYSQNGYYHITICTHNKEPLLFTIKVGRGLAPTAVDLTEIGRIAEEQPVALEQPYPDITIDKYVIMPSHIHAIVIIQKDTAGASSRPTMSKVICSFKVAF